MRTLSTQNGAGVNVVDFPVKRTARFDNFASAESVATVEDQEWTISPSVVVMT